MNGVYDLAIIGGGVNGCGIARDAAGRGLKVFLAERGDLGGGTSSASTKLIHGGLRYLEHYEFRLVREALQEREVLLGMAPHIIWPMRFVLPHHRHLRPRWMIRIGLFLYDNLGGRKVLPGSRGIDLRRDSAGLPLKPEFTHGFEYSDCWVNDARLVVLNAIDAQRRGADIRVGTEVVSAERRGAAWHVNVVDRVTGAKSEITARALVNAAGPWVNEVVQSRVSSRTRSKIRLVKGSHIVVPKLFDHDRAYILQNADQRITFAIPYERDFTLIGTTDVDLDAPTEDLGASEAEISYMCAAASEYFRKPVLPADVVWSYAGVRPLYDEGGGSAQEATRDFVLQLEADNGEPALLNIFGGKITTYRKLAEAALTKLEGPLGGIKPAWTTGATLPGGDFAVDGFEQLVGELMQMAPALGPETARRLARSYGTVAKTILSGANGLQDLGEQFGGGLSEREVRHLVDNEWARSVDDILWRRSKLGLTIDADGRRRLEDWLARNGRGSQVRGLAQGARLAAGDARGHDERVHKTELHLGDRPGHDVQPGHSV
jgi:glycerol-3-phosphate dehydrogenase